MKNVQNLNWNSKYDLLKRVLPYLIFKLIETFHKQFSCHFSLSYFFQLFPQVTLCFSIVWLIPAILIYLLWYLELEEHDFILKIKLFKRIDRAYQNCHNWSWLLDFVDVCNWLTHWNIIIIGYMQELFLVTWFYFSYMVISFGVRLYGFWF